MKFNISRADLLGLLQKVVGVVERKQTLPILANVLIRCGDGRLSMTATDLEMELIAVTDTPDVDANMAITAPARKLFDICRSLEGGSSAQLCLDGDKLHVRSGKAKFTLPTLPAASFPSFESLPADDFFRINPVKLRRVMERSMFAVALQDTRYYLNGLLLEIDANVLRMVGSDGHRLAYSEQALDATASVSQRLVIIPRKGAQELHRLLADEDVDVEIGLGVNALRVLLTDTVFSVKLVDAKYPDYRRAIPRDIGREIGVGKEAFKQALSRVSVVCQEKFKNISFDFSPGILTMSATSPENEEASDAVDIAFEGDAFEASYNGGYIMDALNHCASEQVRLKVADGSSACIIEAEGDTSSKFIVMPLRR